MFIATKNLDDYDILIPVNRISEIILHDKENRANRYCIMMFSLDDHTAIAREDYDTAEEARARFNKLNQILYATPRWTGGV